MLVLDRKVEEGLWIGEHVYIKVLDTGRRRVKLGIQAPIEIRVTRAELISKAPPEKKLSGCRPPSTTDF